MEGGSVASCWALYGAWEAGGGGRRTRGRVTEGVGGCDRRAGARWAPDNPRRGGEGGERRRPKIETLADFRWGERRAELSADRAVFSAVC